MSVVIISDGMSKTYVKYVLVDMYFEVFDYSILTMMLTFVS